MKITLPVHHFPPRYSGGAELYTFRLARWLQVHDHRVEVICIEAIDRGGVGELRAVQDNYQGIPVWRLAFNLMGAGDYHRSRYDNPLLGEWFASYFRNTRPNIVHFQAGYLIGVAPLEAAVAAGIPTVLTLHDYWYLCPRITLQRGDGSLCTTIPEDPAGCAWCLRLERRRYRIPDQLTLGMVGWVAQRLALNAERSLVGDRRARLLPALMLPDAVISPSRFLADRVRPFVQSGRLHLSRLGLDLEPFLAQRRPAPEEALRIGFIGQIARHKGVHLLIEAFRRLRAEKRRVELHIYGDVNVYPDYVRRLRRIAGDDPRIHFHGRFENRRVAEVLTGLDVTIVPSIWYENCPLAILESHAAGTPVVTAALGGMAELVRDGVDGLHFRPADATDLARQLQRLVDEPKLLQHLRVGVEMPRDIDDEMRQVMGIYRNVSLQPVEALQEVAR